MIRGLRSFTTVCRIGRAWEIDYITIFHIVLCSSAACTACMCCMSLLESRITQTSLIPKTNLLNKPYCYASIMVVCLAKLILHSGKARPFNNIVSYVTKQSSANDFV